MKELYLRFREWLKYIRNYKNSEDEEKTRDNLLKDKYEEIKKLKEKIKSINFLNEERANLLKLKEKRIYNLNTKYGELKKEINRLNEDVELQKKINKDLEDKIAEKEHSRRASAGVVGGLKAKINQLQKELEKANYTINFYKNHQKSPNIEELKAYEYQQKEVEKRIKNK